jgi:hypothetical protein
MMVMVMRISRAYTGQTIVSGAAPDGVQFSQTLTPTLNASTQHNAEGNGSIKTSGSDRPTTKLRLYR